jgi:two-component system CheB/CheR fusion protein
MVMVQSMQSAKYAGMPSSAIATGMSDYVLSPAEMPKRLIAYARGPYLTAVAAAPKTVVIDAEPLQRIFALLRSRTGNDFSAYKSNTIWRRIERRMNVHQIRTPDEYVRYLQENAHEIDILFKELLISVTNFFRDKDAWEALAPQLEQLVKSRPDNYVLRIWVPGCATGEEAFSLAIALREAMEKVNRYLPIQIFGTDLDAEAIETARTGQYPDGIAVDVSPKRLERYFVRDDSTYRIRKEIREMVVFATQNVIRHPPFTKLDILSCRNLLIYLNAELQKKLLPIFHYALKPGGLMFLGPSETIGSYTDLFEAIDKRWKIFRRRESVGALHALPEMPVDQQQADEVISVAPAPAAVKQIHGTLTIERALLNRFAPASVVVNNLGDIFFIHGRTGAYLEPAPGEPRNNVFEMAREGLQLELPAAVRECIRKDSDITRESIRVKTNGTYTNVSLSVTKLKEPDSVRGLLLITFRPTLPPPPHAKAARKPGEDSRVKQLERQLQYMKESHQTTQEELETSNEELKSTNEELQSTNEELQSTNEELETSKEEMQSLNEELTTVNSELRSKLDELSQTSNDMQNLLNSTDIATVFLDNDLNIKRYTAKATELVMLRPTDVGRPISELTSNLEFNNLAGECREVLRTLTSTTSEVQTSDGRWYLKRVMPYRTVENVIEGVVITFVNVGHLKKLEKAGETARAYFAAIVDTVREPLIVLNKELRVVSANRAFYHSFRTTPKQTEGELIYELGTGQWDIPKLRQLLEEILPKDAKFEDFEVEVEIPRLGRRIFALNARRLEQRAEEGNLILLALEDMTSGQSKLANP